MSKKTRKNNRKNSSTSTSATPVVEASATPVVETKKSKPGLLRRVGRKIESAAKTSGRGIKKAANAVADNTPGPVKTGLEFAAKGACVTVGVVATIAGANKLVGNDKK